MTDLGLSNRIGSSCKVTGLSAGTAEVKCTVTSVNPTSGTSYHYLIYTVTVNDVSLEPGTWSGNTLTIGGSATSSTNRAPYNNYWTYSTTQMLYSPTEIGKSGTINNIAFKVANTSSFTTTGLKVYLGHKSSIFSSTSDYMTSSNLTLVYSGSPTLGQSTGWETLTFNQGSFKYNGTDNLVVVVAMKSSNYNTSLKYYCYEGSGYVLSRGNDGTTGYGDITNTSYAYSISEERPAVRMIFAGSEPVTDGIAINATNFPDANFRNYLLSQSYGSDGILTQDEINGVTSLDFSSKKIGSLKGIEYFTALKVLECFDNQLTTLDVSKNTVLTSLRCHKNQLTSLDVSKNTALTTLVCIDNQLTTLDVSKNTALNFLSCSGNQLTTLDVSKNTALTTLFCFGNNINGVNMDNLIVGLRQKNTNIIYRFYVINTSDSNEGNVCTKKQVAAIKSKGWTPYDYNGSIDNEYEYEGSEEVESLESISLPESIQLSVGETHTLTPVFTPASATMGVTWSSEDESIATVDEFEGIVTAVSPGTTTIYVVADDAEHIASCQVIVTSGSELEEGVFTAKITNDVQMTFKIIDEDARICQIGTGNGAAISRSTSGEIIIPSEIYWYDVTAIAENAFAGTHIEEVCIPNSIKSIGENAFKGCTSLFDVTSYLNEPFDIPESAFSNISSDASLNVLYGTKSKYLQKTGWNMFSSVWSSIAVIDGIRYSVNGAVPEDKGEPYTAWVHGPTLCSYYPSNVTIPETFMIGTETFTVESIDDGAFHNSYIYSITIPKTITSIDDGAFSGCSQLESVKSYIQNPQDCHVHESSFSNIPSNVTLYVPAGTKSAYEAIPEWNVFACIVEMNEELQDDDIFIAKTIEGVEMTFKVTSTVDKICQVGTGSNQNYFAVHDNTSGKITIPEVANGFTVTNIGDFAFGDGKGSKNLPYITEIIIPNTVTYIGRYSFYDMKALECVTLPTSLTTIPDGAFDGCIALTSIVIPNGTTTIGNGAFEGCGLTDLTIPQSVTSIAWGAFADCNALTSVTVNWEEPIDIDDNCFTNAANATLYVPAGTKAAYEAATGWKNFGSIVEKGEEPEEVEVTDISQMDNIIYIEPVEGHSGSNLSLSVKMKNTVAIRSFGFDLYLPDGITATPNSSGKPWGSLNYNRVPKDDDGYPIHKMTLSYQEGNVIRFLCDAQEGQTFIDNDGEIATLKVNISETMTEGDYPIMLKKVKLSETDIANYYITEELISKITIVSYILGDINNDGVVDVSDYSGVADRIHGRTPVGFNEKAGDVDENGIIDVSDYSGVANLIHYGSIHGKRNSPSKAKKNNNVEPQ